MARPRLSRAQAHLTGALYKHPERFRARAEPSGLPPLGDPPDCLIDPDAREAWREFEAAAPWLNRSHRAFVQIACRLQARMKRGEAGVPALNLLRQCLSSLGLTPTSPAAIRALPEGADPADPANEFFN